MTQSLYELTPPVKVFVSERCARSSLRQRTTGAKLGESLVHSCKKAVARTPSPPLPPRQMSASMPAASVSVMMGTRAALMRLSVRHQDAARSCDASCLRAPSPIPPPCTHMSMSLSKAASPAGHEPKTAMLQPGQSSIAMVRTRSTSCSRRFVSLAVSATYLATCWRNRVRMRVPLGEQFFGVGC